MKTAIIFTGQGSQFPGMGRELFEESPAFTKKISEASEYAGFDIREKMLEADEKELSDTAIAQPVLAAYSAGVIEILKERGVAADCAAGLSLGEYCALYLSGVFDFETLIRLTAFRGKVMKKCAMQTQAVMFAVLGSEAEQIERICAEAEKQTGEMVCISNYNCKGQVVIAGLKRAAGRAVEMIKEAGLGKCVPLKVSSAFHTKLMKPAADELEAYFANVTFKRMNIPVVFNVSGSVLEEPVGAEKIREILVKQVMSPVRMQHSLEFLEAEGVGRVVAVDPGKTIAGFVKRSTGIEVCD